MQAKLCDISVVIPVLNERENLELLLPSLWAVAERLGLVAEIIVVDGGSADESRLAAEQLGARVITQQERGYGGALLAGFAAAHAPFVVTMDADLSHQPIFIKDLWQQRGEAELVIASRYVAGGQAEMGRVRRVLSLVLNRVYGRVLALPTRDLSSGFRMYHRNILANLELQARDFDVQEEILVKLHVKGWRIKEVPFHYMARNSGKSHAKLIRFGWAFSKTLLRMWRLRNSADARSKR
ncbi:MAG TPA: glycosyltransferase [Pyrinomonadaceae bacterium]|nr:glycosyltransferase [Pyrinomonadaceae bacterium]